MRKRISQVDDQSTNIPNDLQEQGSMEVHKEEIIYHEKNHRKPVFYGSILAIVLAIIFSMVSGGTSSEGKAYT